MSLENKTLKFMIVLHIIHFVFISIIFTFCILITEDYLVQHIYYIIPIFIDYVVFLILSNLKPIIKNKDIIRRIFSIVKHLFAVGLILFVFGMTSLAFMGPVGFLNWFMWCTSVCAFVYSLVLFSLEIVI